MPALAIAALRASGFKLPPAGLSRPACARPTGRRAAAADARARSSRSRRPGSELWLDGGHNPDGGRAIAAALADLEERVSRPLVLIVGMLATKDCDGFLRNFAGLARRLYRGADAGCRTKACRPTTVAEARARSAFRRRAASSLDDGARRRSRKLDLDPPPRILITGSLYLAGEVLARTARRRSDRLRSQ